MNKKNEFYKLLIDLTNDDSEEITEEYINKAEKAYSLYIDLFIRPKTEGIDSLCNITINKTDIPKTTETAILYGSAKTDASEITLYVANLRKTKQIVEAKQSLLISTNFKKERNAILMHLFMTTAHEVQHYYQSRLRQELEKGENGDKKIIDFYKQLLGEDAERIAQDSGHITTTQHLETLRDFLRKAGKDTATCDEIIDSHHTSVYLPSSHEYDAREASINAMNELASFLNNYWPLAEENVQLQGNSDLDVIDQIVSMIESLTTNLIKNDNAFKEALLAIEEVTTTQEKTTSEYKHQYDKYQKFIKESLLNLTPQDIVNYTKNTEKEIFEDPFLAPIFTYQMLQEHIGSQLATLSHFKYFENFLNNQEMENKVTQLFKENGMDWAVDDEDQYEEEQFL